MRLFRLLVDGAITLAMIAVFGFFCVVVIFFIQHDHPHDNPHTPYWHGTATYDAKLDNLVGSLQAAGWPERSIHRDQHPNTDQNIVVVDLPAGRHVCPVGMEYYPQAKGNTYRVYSVDGMLPIEMGVNVDPKKFLVPGISRQQLQKLVAGLLAQGIVTCT